MEVFAKDQKTAKKPPNLLQDEHHEATFHWWTGSTHFLFPAWTLDFPAGLRWLIQELQSPQPFGADRLSGPPSKELSLSSPSSPFPPLSHPGSRIYRPDRARLSGLGPRVMDGAGRAPGEGLSSRSGVSGAGGEGRPDSN